VAFNPERMQRYAPYSSCAYPSGMQPRRHRMRRQARRESSRAWIASGAAVTIKAYARRYGVDRYTAYEDLTAIGFPLPDSARRWAHRPPQQPRPRRSATSRALLEDDWIIVDGRPYFVAGHTPGGAPYGIYLDEMDDNYPSGMITPCRPGQLSDFDLFGP
jgi:hypothetical protein